VYSEVKLRIEAFGDKPTTERSRARQEASSTLLQFFAGRCFAPASLQTMSNVHAMFVTPMGADDGSPLIVVAAWGDAQIGLDWRAREARVPWGETFS